MLIQLIITGGMFCTLGLKPVESSIVVCKLCFVISKRDCLYTYKIQGVEFVKSLLKNDT